MNILESYGSSFQIGSPESWLILTIYTGFWIYSYYSLIVFLIHIRKQNNSIENIDLEKN